MSFTFTTLSTREKVIIRVETKCTGTTSQVLISLFTIRFTAYVLGDVWDKIKLNEPGMHNRCRWAKVLTADKAYKTIF